MVKQTRRKILKLVALSLVVMMAVGTFHMNSAHADSLVKKYIKVGRIGEQYNGLLGLVHADRSQPILEEHINKVNAERMAQYEKIAQQNNTDIQQVQLLAGKELISKLRPGSYYKTSEGVWVRK